MSLQILTVVVFTSANDVLSPSQCVAFRNVVDRIANHQRSHRIVVSIVQSSCMISFSSEAVNAGVVPVLQKYLHQSKPSSVRERERERTGDVSATVERRTKREIEAGGSSLTCMYVKESL